MARLGAGLFLCLVVMATHVQGLTEEERITKLEGHVRELTRLIALQNHYAEEQVRSDGMSGVKQIRLNDQGVRPDQSTGFSDYDMMSAHNHANHRVTLGLAELSAVLNGVTFTTRHNDHLLRMKHTTSDVDGATEEIPFPSVPQEVTDKATVAEEVDEMREFFRAWNDHNSTHRNYKPYFKAVLCYLEGAWTDVNSTAAPDEPFLSDRHMLKVATWNELHENSQNAAETCLKDRLENLPQLPTKVRRESDGGPVMAQWNYRILCHPLKDDLPLNQLQPVYDEKSLREWDLTEDEYPLHRSARFQLVPNATFDSKTTRTALDEVMEQVPGWDNYQGNLTDVTKNGNTVALKFEKDSNGKDVVLNSAYYHRYIRRQHAGAAQDPREIRVGMNDEMLYRAQTSQSRVSGLTGETDEQKFTWAIPLEIVYLTPLTLWNPHGINYKGDADSADGATATADGRTGKTAAKAFNGTNSKNYYMTPLDFFSDSTEGMNSDDDSLDKVHVLDPSGNAQRMRAAGHRIVFPNIPGLAKIRQRYPIMPIHEVGSNTWMELSAATGNLYDAIDALAGARKK